MKISKLAIAMASFVVSAIASSQTLPPPSFAGQSYWFGPGPSAYTLDSFTQDTGGYSEQFLTGATWTVTGGGPGYLGPEDHGTFFRSYFGVTTTAVIEPYIYVDGYFGVTANIHGYGANTVSLGTSRFYVIHNVPIIFGGFNFSDVRQPGAGGASLPTSYAIAWHDYVNPGDYASSTTVSEAGPSNFEVTISNATDGGLLEVNITRSCDVPAQASAGTYEGIGVIYVSGT